MNAFIYIHNIYIHIYIDDSASKISSLAGTNRHKRMSRRARASFHSQTADIWRPGEGVSLFLRYILIYIYICIYTRQNISFPKLPEAMDELQTYLLYDVWYTSGIGIYNVLNNCSVIIARCILCFMCHSISIFNID